MTPEALGELAAIRRLLEDIRAAVVEPSGGLDEPRKLEWAVNGGYEDVDLGGWFPGVFVINETADDLYIGFGPGTGTSARRMIKIGAWAFISVPYRCSFVSVGGDVAGSAVVFPLRSSAASPVTGV